MSRCSSYRDNGYLVVRGFLSASELSELRAGIDEAVAQLGRRKLSGSTGDRWLAGETYYDRVFLQRINLWKINAAVKQYMLAPELGQMLCALEGIGRHPPLARPDAAETAVGQPHRLALRQPEVVLPLAARHLHLDRHRSGDAAERLPCTTCPAATR